jgi:hypothetical protein
MFDLSIALLIWLGIGFIGGMRVVIDKEFWDYVKSHWEDEEIGKLIDYPKNPKLFFLAIHVATGPFWIYRTLQAMIRNRKEN